MSCHKIYTFKIYISLNSVQKMEPKYKIERPGPDARQCSVGYSVRPSATQ